MHRSRTVVIASACAVLACLVLAACSGGGPKVQNARSAGANDLDQTLSSLSDRLSSDSDSIFASSTTKTPNGSPIGKIRILNALTVNGQPGPAIDLYDGDTRHIDANYQPIIKNLQYGKVSDYVSPKGWGPGATTSNLYIFPAGSQTPTALLTGSNIDNSGFEDGDQLTISLYSLENGQFGSSDIDESGSRSADQSQISIPASDGTLMPRTAMENPTNVGEYLTIDGGCVTESTLGTGSSTNPIQIGENTGFENFGVAAGSHSFGAITSSPGHGLTTCTPTAAGTTTANVVSGKKMEIFVFGDPTAPQVVTAPVS